MLYNGKDVTIVEGQQGMLLIKFDDGSGQRWVHGEDLSHKEE